MTTTMVPAGEDTAQTARAVFADRYLGGLCVALAVAIHRRTGWPLIAARNVRGELQHAGVRTPEGLCMDVRGEMSEWHFMTPFIASAVVPVDEGTLLREDPKIGEEDIADADGRLPSMFPALPGESSRAGRMMAFADDLEAICRKHGIWLRDDGPHGMVVYEGDGDESGFRLSFGMAGEVRMHRVFGDHEDDPAFGPAP